MPPTGPTKRGDLIRNFSKLGFKGPFSGGRHQFMLKGDLSVRIPNPHKGNIGVDLLSRILRQAGIDSKQWEKL